MPNPLRLPLVLIVVFAAMLTYVHQHHRQQMQDNAPPLFEHEDESLQLRQSAGPQERATLVGPSWFDAQPPSPAAAPESAGRARAPAAARLPGLSDPPTPIPGPSSAAVTLWPPDSAYARFNAPASATHHQPTGVEPPSASLPAIPATTSDARPREFMHRIVDGDTLPALAETYLGDPSRWRDLLEANRDVLVHPDLLPLGERIRIPLAPPHMREGE